MNKSFASLSIWQATLVMGAVVATTIWLIGYFNKPKTV